MANRIPEDNQPTRPFKSKNDLRTWVNVCFNIFIILALYLVSFVVIDTSASVDWTKRGYELVFIYFAGYTIFSNSYSIGKLKGAKKKAYTDAESKCTTAVETLQINCNFEHLEDFCEYIKSQDLAARRKSTLTAVCLKWKDWEDDYKNHSLKELYARKKTVKLDGQERSIPVFDFNQRKALFLAKRMRYHKFTPAMLTSPVVAKSDEFLNNPTRTEHKKKISRLIMSAIFALITVNFSAELVKDFSFQTVVESLVKSMSLLWAWVSGQYSGYTNAVIDRVEHYLDKAKWCNRADKWLKEYKPSKEQTEDTPKEQTEKEGVQPEDHTPEETQNL